MNIHDDFSLLAFAGEEISMRSSNESLLSLLVSLMKRNEKESVNLIHNLLKKFSELDSRCLDKLKILAPELVIQPSDSTLSGDASNSSSMSDRKAVSHEKQPAKVEKIWPERLAFLKSRGLTGESDSDGNSCPICLDGDSKFPLYFFTVLQKSRVVSLLDKGRPSLVKEVQRSEKEQVSVSHEDLNVQTLSTSETVISSELVHKAIEKLAAFVSQVDAFQGFIKIHAPHIERIHSPLTSHGVSSRKKENEKQTTLLDNAFEESLYTQVLCVMKGDAKAKEFLTAGCSSNEYLLPAKYIASLYDKSLNKVKALPSSVTSFLAYNAFGPLDCNGIYVSSCGHAAHQKCLEKYLLGLKPRNAGGTSLSLESVKNGFPCFMCRALGNSMLPNLPREGTKDSRQFKSEVPSSLDAQDKQEGGTDLELISLLRGMYLSKADKILGPNQVSDSMIMWDTLKYSLIHAEIVGRSERTSSSVDALYEGLKSSNAFMLSLLLRIVNRTRVKNALDVLLRLMCIKKLAKSICSHDAPSEPPSGDTYGVEESIMKMLENADMGKRFPDIQFWAMASYPVLASDAFSTFMWILFCLPVPFMSSEKAFFSLVHLCYAVSISQAAIACYGRKRSMNDLSDDNKLIVMIFEFMDGHGGSLSQYLVSRYMENFRDIMDAIRSLSYPFLRRCGLLWKIINASTSTPFEDTPKECTEVDDLENMFKIPTWDSLVKDDLLLSLVRKWLDHVAKEFKVSKPSGVLHLTPAVPFKLMVLDTLYEDLLHECMKTKCVECGALQDEPMLCLLCGALCSSSENEIKNVENSWVVLWR